MKGKWKTIRRMVDLALIVLNITWKVNGLLERRRRDGVDERRASDTADLSLATSTVASEVREHSSSGAESAGSHMLRHSTYALKTKQERDGCVRRPVYPQQQRSASSPDASVWSCGPSTGCPATRVPGRSAVLPRLCLGPVKLMSHFCPPELLENKFLF